MYKTMYRFPKLLIGYYIYIYTSRNETNYLRRKITYLRSVFLEPS